MKVELSGNSQTTGRGRDPGFTIYGGGVATW